jgi:tyrosyl-tRNA synthetase
MFAEEIITRFHNAEAAVNAHKGAGNSLKHGEIPDDVPEVVITVEEGVTELPISAVLNRAGLVKNAAGAKDVLSRGVVFVDGQAVGVDFRLKLAESRVIQAGKKAIARVVLQG